MRSLDETEKQTTCTKKVRQPFSGYDSPVSQVGEDTATDPPSGDFLRRDAYTDELLDTLAGKLNSNEEFHPDRGLQVTFALIY